MIPVPPDAPRVCDLILLTWNRVDLTRPCVERILKSTQLPVRLIIVDNGSTDQASQAFLHEVTGTSWVQVEVIRRPRNDGYAVGMNTGLANATAPWVCLLNNDILVTDGWLEEMIRVGESDRSLGLINPMSNEFGVSPQPEQSIDSVAEQCRHQPHAWIEHWGGVGFCLLIPQPVLKAVGGLDEEFQFMYFEDADYSLRVRQAGFHCAVAERAYVWHHGSATMKQDPSRDQRFADNANRFYHKWPQAKPQRIAWILGRKQARLPDPLPEQIRELANRGHKVWVVGIDPTTDRLPRHLHIVPKMISSLGRAVKILAWVLTKKKRFHRIVTGTPSWERIFAGFASVHRAQVESPTHLSMTGVANPAGGEIVHG